MKLEKIKQAQPTLSLVDSVMPGEKANFMTVTVYGRYAMCALYMLPGLEFGE